MIFVNGIHGDNTPYAPSGMFHFLQDVIKNDAGESVDKNNDGIIDDSNNLSCNGNKCYINGELYIKNTIQFQVDSSVCNAGRAGTLRWNGSIFQGCDGTKWFSIVDGTPELFCGDASCNNGENCATCPADCGACCGDGTCNYAETCSTCPADCGACMWCGDGSCNNGETCSSCASDCGSCCTPATCASLGKTCGTWSDGCGGTVTCGGTCPYCGDGSCNNGETCSSCSNDCGTCPPNCINPGAGHLKKATGSNYVGSYIGSQSTPTTQSELDACEVYCESFSATTGCMFVANSNPAGPPYKLCYPMIGSITITDNPATTYVTTWATSCS